MTGFFLHSYNSASISAFDIFLCIFLSICFLFHLAQWVIMIFLWNDIFWDSTLPWASFDSQLCNIFQQIALAAGTSLGDWSLQAKLFMIVLFFILGISEIYRNIVGYVPYKEIVMKINLSTQACLCAFSISFFFLNLYGDLLTPYLLLITFCCGCGMVFFVLNLLQRNQIHSLMANISSQNKLDSTTVRYLNFLLFQHLNHKCQNEKLIQILHEHNLMCNRKDCVCTTLLEEEKKEAFEIDQDSSREKWFYLLGKSLLNQFKEGVEVDIIWIVRMILLILGESNPYQALIEIQRVSISYNYDISTKFILYQFRKRCEKMIRDTIQTSNENNSDCVQVLELCEYEKEAEALHFSLKEAAELALEFWRELSIKQFRVERFQEKGEKLLEIFSSIQKKATRLFSDCRINDEISADYSIFTQKIMNNAMDQTNIRNLKARKCHQIDRKSQNTLYAKTATILVKVNHTDSCLIKSTNKRITEILGYLPHQLVGKDIKCFMTQDVGNNHAEFIKSYVRRGEINGFVNMPSFTFAKLRNGFLQPIKSKVMLLPHFDEGIYFIALIQNGSYDRACTWSRPNCEKQRYRFISSNKEGEILGVTHNCLKSYGIAHCHFVSPNKASLKQLYTIKDILPELKEPEILSRLDHREELVLHLNTEIIAKNVDREAVNGKQCAQLLERTGQYEVLVSKDIVRIGSIEQHIYKIIDPPQLITEEEKREVGTERKEDRESVPKKEVDYTEIDSVHSISDSSASYSSTENFNKEFTELKVSIMDKSFPFVLKLVNLWVIILAFLIILFGGILLIYTQGLIKEEKKLCNSLIFSYNRRFQQALCRVQIRTLWNIANDIEENIEIYGGKTKFAYIQGMLNTQLSAFALAQNRIEHLDVDLLQKNIYESQRVFPISRINIDYSVTTQYYMTTVGINDFISSAHPLVNYTIEDLKTDFYYAHINGTIDKSVAISHVDKKMYKLLENAFYATREALTSGTNAFSDSSNAGIISMNSTLNILLYISLGLIAFCFTILFPLILNIHFNKRSVLSIYSEMKLSILSGMIKNCISFLQNIQAKNKNEVVEYYEEEVSKEEPQEINEETDCAQLIQNKEEEIVGKQEEFRRFDKVFIYQLILLSLFCIGLFSYYIYKYFMFASFISDGKDIFNNLNILMSRSQSTVNIVGLMKEAWLKGSIFTNSKGKNEVLYYLKEQEEIENKLMSEYKDKSVFFGLILGEIMDHLESSEICSYAIEETNYCNSFWNGILNYGLSNSIFKIVHEFYENYFRFSLYIKEKTYTEEVVKKVLSEEVIKKSEEFIYRFLYPTTNKYNNYLIDELENYFQQKKPQ